MSYSLSPLCGLALLAIVATLAFTTFTRAADETTPADLRARPEYGVAITYRWQAAPMAKDYSIFVHLLDAQGRMVMQDDHAPPMPTSKWNGPVEYTRNLHLPAFRPKGKETVDPLPEGKYTIVAGLFHKEGGNAPLAMGEGVADAGQNRYQIGELIIDKNVPKPTLPPKTLDLAGYHITFQDEFDQPLSVSANGPCGEGGTKWMAHTPYGGDFGDSKFADPTPTFPFTVKDGLLTIEARKNEKGWESGLLSSMDTQGNRFAQQYGYFEMRAKFPRTPGTWPAFWLHAKERVTHAKDLSKTFMEVDIIEQYGHWPNKFTTAIHLWKLEKGAKSEHLGKNFIVDGMTDDFHTYGCLVTKEYVTFYYDGRELRREPTPDAGHTPLYVMVNLALGPGWPIDKTPSPSAMQVDYVRVYAKD
jgi:hypothetical protein